MTRTPTNGSHVSPSVSLGMTLFFFLSISQTGTSDRTLIALYLLLKFLGFSLYPLLFFLYSLLKKIFPKFEVYVY